MRGMAPWAQASTLPPAWRALLLALTAWSAALLVAYVVLRSAVRTRIAAIVLGAAGPVAALGLLRLLERADARPSLFALLPVAACVSPAALALAARARAELGRLRQGRRAASSSSRV
jgi:glycerol-3-phosphate acyltransferase PlsY